MHLPRAMTGWVPEHHRLVFGQVVRFGVVGTLGFLVDSAVLLAAMALGAGPYGGRVVSYLAAATTTWAANRAWTFRGAGGGAAHQQWVRFLLVNLVGFALNYGAYALLVAFVPVVATYPLLGVAAGALVGMTGNFLLSRRYVFAVA
ncbi:GtrA family protein [Roseomonas sp. OT10]|uniref:GtrA family protein n=1 Tax=Roseomonas cutis TaxID=2897332 RepID=UPI001E33CF60|nr:GtrA family protein [Roseomonas sp. OT10]UFN51092.1 GtrA family protein [Roseomonas sp. OT10]